MKNKIASLTIRRWLNGSISQTEVKYRVMRITSLHDSRPRLRLLIFYDALIGEIFLKTHVYSILMLTIPVPIFQFQSTF